MYVRCGSGIASVKKVQIHYLLGTEKTTLKLKSKHLKIKHFREITKKGECLPFLEK